MTFSVLQNKPILIEKPYPHFVIENALPEDLYNQLETEWPEQQLLNTTPYDNGICYRLKANEMLKPNVVSDAWKKFCEVRGEFAQHEFISYTLIHHNQLSTWTYTRRGDTHAAIFFASLMLWKQDPRYLRPY